MRDDPTAELLQAMAQVGLSPMNILWDGAFHRFPGIGQEKGDNGYYKAFVDQRGAVFGDWRTKEKWNWPGDSEQWKEAVKHLKPLSAAEVEKQRKEADAARAKAEKRDTRNILDMWERGKDCKNHPYLEAKGIRNVSFLKSIIDPETEEEMLLIPMRNANRKIRNIQRIWPDGSRKQMPQAGGSVGLYNTIGAHRYRDTKILYVCEGWATGWTIHMATNLAVIVAFFDGGLKTVGKVIREKYPEARLIFAADNDRWKPVNRSGKMVNPGVYAVREAAKALNAEYCIPDFADLETKPTDYDDLRRLEGLDAVRRRLEPAMAEHAVTEAPQEADEEPEHCDEAEAEPDEDPHWSESFPSRFLGVEGTNFYFLNQYGDFQQASRFSKRDMLSLAPLDWYREHFGTRTKYGDRVDWYGAMGALIDRGSKSGLFRPDRVRGLGYWSEDGRPLLHLGDQLLLADGTTEAPATYCEGDGIYPRQLPPLKGPDDEPLRLSKAKRILRLFESLLWEVPAAAYMAAGWTVLAPLCGFLRRRPHIWITGPPGCGKTTIIDQLIMPLTGGFCLPAKRMDTTADMLRRELGNDALPVLIDEPRPASGGSTARIDRIIELMLSASTGGLVVRTTPHGKPLSYRIRSMFCLGRLGWAQPDPQDQHRITELCLRDPRELGDKAAQDAHWHAIQGEIDRLPDRVAEMLLARTHDRWVRTGRLQTLLEITKSAAGTVLGRNRAADQFGTLFAGAFILLDEKVPDEKSVIAKMQDLGLGAYVEKMRPAGRRILDLLFQVREVVSTSNGTIEMSVGEMIALVANPQSDGSKGLPGLKDAKRHLRDIGFVLHHGNLYVANQSVWISKTLAGTSFADDHASLLRALPPAEAGGRRWFAGRQSRTTRIPVKSLYIPRVQSRS